MYLLFKPSEKPLFKLTPLGGSSVKTSTLYSWLASSLQLKALKQREGKKGINGILVFLGDEEPDGRTDMIVYDGETARILEYLNINSAANFYIDNIYILRKKDKATPFVHRYVKTAKYIREDYILSKHARQFYVSELGLYSLTTGIDRFGMSAKYLVLQTAFMRDILGILSRKLNHEEDSKNFISQLVPYHNNDLENGDKVASITSLMLAYTRALKILKEAEASYTTAVWAPKDTDEKNIREDYQSFVKFISNYNKFENHSDLLVKISYDDFFYIKLNNSLRFSSRISLGRLKRVLAVLHEFYKNNKKCYANNVEPFTIIMEWSEQMGPIDIALLLLLLKVLGIDPLNTNIDIRVIATPLSLPHALIGKLYLDHVLGKRGNDARKSKIVLSSGIDHHVVIDAVKYIVDSIDNNRIIYFSAGSTLHTVVAYATLESLSRTRGINYNVVSWNGPNRSLKEGPILC